MEVKIKRLHPDARAPEYATDGAACFDLRSVDHIETTVGGQPRTFRTGLSFEVPEGHAMLIFSRSGHGFKNDTRLANCVGIIDSDYRGEVAVRLTRDDARNEALFVKAGDRIAQAMVVPVDRVEFIEAEDLTATERGAGGFGSTGAA